MFGTKVGTWEFEKGTLSYVYKQITPFELSLLLEIFLHPLVLLSFSGSSLSGKCSRSDSNHPPLNSLPLF
jgi:hypothetical protein